jgi:hypothetical protein
MAAKLAVSIVVIDEGQIKAGKRQRNRLGKRAAGVVPAGNDSAALATVKGG